MWQGEVGIHFRKSAEGRRTLGDEGRSLALFPIPQVAWCLSALADSLAHAHQKGVTHRDLKPKEALERDS